MKYFCIIFLTVLLNKLNPDNPTKKLNNKLDTKIAMIISIDGTGGM